MNFESFAADEEALTANFVGVAQILRAIQNVVKFVTASRRNAIAQADSSLRQTRPID